MGYYCMMVNGISYCMKFDEYMSTGWNFQMAMPAKEIFKDQVGHEDESEIIKMRQERSDAYLNGDK